MNHTWSYLIDGDEQPDQPNSQTCMEWCHECTALFLGFDINTTAYYLDLHFLQLKSSLTYQIINSYYCSFSSTSSMVMSFLTKICIVEHTYNRLGYRPDQYRFFFKKMYHPRPLLFLVFSSKHYYFYNNTMWKMSIQYPVPWFDPSTTCTWVSSRNH